MDQYSKSYLKTYLNDSNSHESSAELKAYLDGRAKQIRRSGFWIGLIAGIVGLSYLAFQDWITIMLLSILLVIGIGALVYITRKDARHLMITEEEAQELFLELYPQKTDESRKTE